MNRLNLELQGKGQLVCDMYDSIRATCMKLQLFHYQIKKKNFAHFPSLKDLDESSLSNCEMHCEIPQSLLESFETRFQDF